MKAPDAELPPRYLLAAAESVFSFWWRICKGSSVGVLDVTDAAGGVAHLAIGGDAVAGRS